MIGLICSEMKMDKVIINIWQGEEVEEKRKKEKKENNNNKT